MPFSSQRPAIAVFDLGGTWFRWGSYTPRDGLSVPQRMPAVSYLSHPSLSTQELQERMLDFIVARTRDLDRAGAGLMTGSVSIGAAVNAHDDTVLGSGPLWGASAKPFQLRTRLQAQLPELRWHVVNDITALLANYMVDAETSVKKTLLITVSTGIGARLYDHRWRRIPYDPQHGVQGEIGHLPVVFALDGRVIERPCECGGRNHLNAFASGRGIARVLADLPTLIEDFAGFSGMTPDCWSQAGDARRLATFNSALDAGNPLAGMLLDALVAPLSRILAAALSLDPEIERIVMTGGVAHGLGGHYRESLCRTFSREGLYQITERDPQYLVRRLVWDEGDTYSGLRGAGIYAAIHTRN